jgi:hypothetical protein
MKPSHLTTPRNFADCTWIQGYGRKPTLWERIQGPVLAISIGIGMAALLVAWWSS